MTSLLLAALLAAAPSDPAAGHRLIGLLEYLEGDYGKAVATGDQTELAEQRGLAAEAVAAVARLGEPGEPYRARVAAISERINKAEDPAGVARDCRLLADDLALGLQLLRFPKHTPQLARGAALWSSTCASCHGATGDGKGPAAAALRPPPFDFHAEAGMATLTPYKAFNTTTFGINGTGMVSFRALPEDDRWALAFYAFTFRQPPCDHAPVAATLEELASSTDAALAARYGAQEIACLRRQLPEAKATRAMFGDARAGLELARTRYAAGDHEGARGAVVDAYLNGIEPIEPLLKARNPHTVQRLEQAFTRTRIAADRGERFEEESGSLLKLLDETEAHDSRGDFWSVFAAALFILLREGFEALVVVGALLAVLKKLNATAQARVVYAAVVAALGAGLLALLFAQQLLAGANREWMESLVAFFAVGMLLYAALWLNARSTMSSFMTDLRDQMKTALGSGSNAGLFTVAFTAVARESFETALFIQGLAGDSPRGALWGAAAGLLGLAVMVVIIRRVGFVLPMKTLFSASTALLLATAVMVLGKGLHGLQEVAVLPLVPISFFEFEPLGIFPDALCLGPQLLLAFGTAWWWRRSFVVRRPPVPQPSP